MRHERIFDHQSVKHKSLDFGIMMSVVAVSLLFLLVIFNLFPGYEPDSAEFVSRLLSP